MALPKKIKIGSQTWTVEERSKLTDGMLNDDSYGYTLQQSNMIVVDKALPISRKRQTLLHELLHAIRYTQGGSGIKPDMENVLPHEVISTWEHYFIGVYEDGLLSVLRDNPSLVSFLLEKDA